MQKYFVLELVVIINESLYNQAYIFLIIELWSKKWVQKWVDPIKNGVFAYNWQYARV